MAILKSKEIAKMNEKEIHEKLKELKSDLIKSRVPAKKVGKGTREIKRTIAKLLTKINQDDIFGKSSEKVKFKTIDSDKQDIIRFIKWLKDMGMYKSDKKYTESQIFEMYLEALQ
jgi:ribosomal protein L29